MKIKNIFLIIISITLINANYVKEIIIIGNLKTKTSVLYNNIKHPVNAPFNSEIAKNDQKRLKNLECFEAVSIKNKDSLYQIYVVEKPSITFLPIINKEDGIGWAGGINLDFNNIQGKTNRLYTKVLFGNIKKYNIEFVDRKLGKSHYQMKINYETSESASIENNYTLYNSTITLKFLTDNFKNKLGFYISKHSNKIDIKNNNLFNIQNDKFSYLVYTLTYKNNFLFNYGKQFLKIHYNYYHSQKYEHDNYTSFLMHTEKSIFLGNQTTNPKLKFKFLASLKSKNNLPYYENEFLGGDKYVRGYKPNPELNPEKSKDKLKFFNMLIYSMEFLIPVEEQSNLINNLNLMFFVDYGLGSNSFDNFNLSNKIKSFGVGCTFNMSMVEKEEFILSFGLNEFGKRQLHFHANQIIF